MNNKVNVDQFLGNLRSIYRNFSASLSAISKKHKEGIRDIISQIEARKIKILLEEIKSQKND